uniref:follistatin-related protein 5-like n=1 Tax=Myxine glutinosa TaxID=7769 RepID=UPI00358EB182
MTSGRRTGVSGAEIVVKLCGERSTFFASSAYLTMVFMCIPLLISWLTLVSSRPSHHPYTDPVVAMDHFSGNTQRHSHRHEDHVKHQFHLRHKSDHHSKIKGHSCKDQVTGSLKDTWLELEARTLGLRKEEALGVSGQEQLPTYQIISRLFSRIDSDSDSVLSMKELTRGWRGSHRAGRGLDCPLRVFVHRADKDSDNRLSLPELLAVFNVSAASLPFGDNEIGMTKQEREFGQEKKAVQNKLVLSVARVGQSIALACGVVTLSGVRVMWTRRGVTLNRLGLEDVGDFGDDRLLYITLVTPAHMGIYTCQAEGHSGPEQQHALQVIAPPVLRIFSESQLVIPGESLSLWCLADGLPSPSISWLKNGENITGNLSPSSSSDSIVRLAKARFEDTGAYVCAAQNEAGEDQDVASVFVESRDRQAVSRFLLQEDSSSELFYIFADLGVTVAAATDCSVLTVLTPSEAIGSSQLCPDGRCTWGEALSLRDRMLVVCQPSLNRIVFFDLTTHRPLQVVPTDPWPVELHYDRSHDQLWVRSEGEPQSQPTLQVVREASTPGNHHVVHTQPLMGHFAAVTGFYIPAPTLLVGHTKFGYAFHRAEQTIFKIDLESAAYVKNISLMAYGCMPVGAAYSPLGGTLLVSCASEDEKGIGTDGMLGLQVVVDMVTDVALGWNGAVRGNVAVSPDGRHFASRDGEVLHIQPVSELGELTGGYSVSSNAPLGTLRFTPAPHNTAPSQPSSSLNSKTPDSQHQLVPAGYVALVVSGEEDILRVSTWDGHAEMVHGLQAGSILPQAFSGGGLLGRFAIALAKDSATVIDGGAGQAVCQLGGLVGATGAALIGGG